VLDHPTYDAYWQSLTPQGREFAHIDIPVLTTTGYFDGAQRGALHYFTQHLARNKEADHYVLIGPWEHFGSQGRPLATIAGYQTDPVSRLDITGIIYQWMDYVMKGGPKPAILADRINYQVMGTNAWKHAPSLEAMSNDTMTFYLSNVRSGDRYQLRSQRGTDADVIPQRVDLTNRTASSDNSIHDPLASSTLDVSNGLTFVSEPLPEAVTISGSFVGTLRASINKRDMDIGVQLYELTPEGQYFQLSFFVGRASLAKDRTRRRLLTPAAIESIPFSETRMISRVLGAGSRLVVVVNVNLSSQSPVNYGSGKDVSAESIADAGAPLRIEWRGTSGLKVPIWR
jgi:putative CocE/NonD family hydrolase